VLSLNSAVTFVNVDNPDSLYCRMTVLTPEWVSVAFIVKFSKTFGSTSAVEFGLNVMLGSVGFAVSIVIVLVCVVFLFDALSMTVTL